LSTPFQSLIESLKKRSDKLTLAQLIVSFFGLLGAISAFSFAIFQYRRAESYRRLEIVAIEAKEFEEDSTARNALLSVD